MMLIESMVAFAVLVVAWLVLPLGGSEETPAGRGHAFWHVHGVTDRKD